ncbi:MAG TPA: FG-GAP-like repeat-containing protein [Bryobacteraceae bacterium]|jgi:Flp pilus assembly protein TadD|nr:FG-GAP-like repeat-containing protein [Bryobacteraceae bacterium]
MNRRHFLGTLAAPLVLAPRHAAAAPFPVHFRKPAPYESLERFIAPGNDDFPAEKTAAEIPEKLRRLPETRALPLAPGFHGVSPVPARYRPVAGDCFEAEFGAAAFDGYDQWLASLGPVRAARFYVLPGDRIRYEIATTDSYRVGLWRQVWRDGRLAEFQPLSETLTRSPRPLFRDATAELFAGCESFREQMLRGVPYWRARLDSASGIDIYGSNGIAVGDIDGDGVDEVYVCQPGGLPNRLYKMRGGRFEDITERAGVGLLDDTSCALFADFRNTGVQDLVVLRSAGPVLFLNQRDGSFALRDDAFLFHGSQQGSFTGMSAADYDRDGRLDLYLCTYTFFQSEDQYRYPTPYHDARNGPPNFLFRNRLAADGSGCFEDTTEAAGLNQNNDRFSFAPAWCDADGDGWPDLYVANDFGRHNFYRNRGGHFEDVAAAAGVEDIGPGMSAAWFDADGDGRPDLYVSNMWSEAGQRVVADPTFRPAATPELREAYRRHTKGNSLYHNRGDGTFAETPGVEMGRWAWSAGGFDFDNDGVPEIYCTCGMLTGPNPADLMSFFWRQVVAKSPVAAQRSEAYENGWNAINQFIREDYSWNGREPNVFYIRRNGRYFDASGISGIDCALDSRAFAVTDFDGDGNLDLLLKSRLAPQIQAFRNGCAGGRKAIALRLTGTKSNRDAIGARAEADGVVRWLEAGSGYLSQHTKTLHFGLGNADEVRALRILWPSGERQEFHGLRAGFRYDITEGSAELRKQPFAAPASPAASEPYAAPDNQTRVHDTWLLDPVPLPDRRRGPGLLYIGAGERPAITGNVEVVNLSGEPDDTAARYAVFRRYLLDWRPPLDLPLLLLIDGQSRAHKLYAAPPSAAALAEDLRLMDAAGRKRLALPFPGDYVGLPRRNYFKFGAAFYQAGYPDEALPYLEAAARQSPANGKALNAIGQIHLERGRLAEARTWLERAVAIAPALGEAWNNLGGVEMRSGNLEAALRNYRRAMELLPNAVYPLVNAGQVEARLGRNEAAVKLLKKAIEIDPADGGAINDLGVLYSQMGQTNDAIAAFEYGIRVAPDNEMLYMNLGRVYVRLGDRTRARDAMLRLLERKPGNAAAANALRELEGR